MIQIVNDVQYLHYLLYTFRLQLRIIIQVNKYQIDKLHTSQGSCPIECGVPCIFSIKLYNLSTIISNYVSTYILLYFCPEMARRRLHYTAGKPLWSIKFIAAIKIYTEPGSGAAKLNFPANADSRFMEPLYFAA